MIQAIWALVAFVIAVSVLVTVHEFGHFYVARLVGVKVLRFSIGFGKALYRRQCQSGLEFVIAAVPLGGYVKMLDERESHVAERELPYAFNRQSVWRRIAIILAGPLFNILFAVLAYWLIFVIGTTSIKPMIGEIVPQSIAAQAGLRVHDQFIRIADDATPSWQAVRLQLLMHLGEDKHLPMAVMRDGQQKQYLLDLTGWQVDEHEPRPLQALGIVPYYPKLPLVITKVGDGTSAEKAGLLAGDKIIAINQKKIEKLPRLIETISDNVGKTIDLTVERNGQQQWVAVYVKPVSDTFIKGRIGVQFDVPKWPDNLLLKHRYSLLSAWGPALQKTWDMTALSFVLLGKMVVGEKRL